MERDDTGTVVAVENEELAAWNESLVAGELSQKNSLSLVASIDDAVVGWCCCRFYRDEAKLFKIAVLRKYKRRSIGTVLLSTLQKKLQDINVKHLFLEVRSKSKAAVSFYQQAGFTPVGRRIKYYSQPRDDAVIFRKTFMKYTNMQETIK